MNIRIALMIVFGWFASMPVHSANAPTPEQPLSKTALKELSDANELYLKKQQERTEFVKKLSQIGSQYGYNHGYMSQIGQVKKQMMSKKYYWDQLLSFKSLTSLLSDGAAKGMFLVGGVVDEVAKSVKTVDKNLIMTEDTKYIIKQYPRLSVSPPYWQDYIFTGDDLDLSLPSRSLLPQSETDREIWEAAIEKGWTRGEESALNELRSRYNQLFADLIGMVRYWTLVETGMIQEVTVDSANYYLQHQKLENGESLVLNPTTIEITQQSTFVAKPEQWDAIITEQSSTDARQDVRDGLVQGALTLEELTSADVTIFTPQHHSTMEQVKREYLK